MVEKEEDKNHQTLTASECGDERRNDLPYFDNVNIWIRSLV